MQVWFHLKSLLSFQPLQVHLQGTLLWLPDSTFAGYDAQLTAMEVLHPFVQATQKIRHRAQPRIIR